ncbi:MAG: (1-_4)-alpha-D-glucan 1-alpha-D-glucosylmutase [Acetobacteraceae bacterium]|nr:(1->4)-alpha-D-glucan 1-alpha-D-glucosylmutase [Acetobacteraceae bacterium]
MQPTTPRATMQPTTARATMRLQLHKGFTFADAAALVPYLVDMGISHVYSSPILTARAGSIHGYDVVDPTAVNPELGGEGGLRDFVAELRAAGLGLIVDIVPNHMAVGGSDNPWWTDLLRHGRSSRYADFFDVDWESDDPDLRGKVLAPFLGRPYGEALEAGDIRVVENSTGNPAIRYFDSEFPITPSDYAHVCECGVESFDPSTRDGQENLHSLLERQHYRLAWWGAAGDEINWRRFFDINGLAGLRIEVPDVFEVTHATLFRLYADGLIDGFRVDHVDGLSDPPGYCRRLRQRLNELAPDRHAYLVIEKILGAGESLPSDWGVDGTSGYDFMNEVSALQHDLLSAPALGRLWHDTTHRPADFEHEEVQARLEILQRGFDAQLNAVTRALHRIARADRKTRDISAAAIRRGLVALLSHFPVYRGYDAGSDRSALDQVAFGKALAAAKRGSPASAHAVLDQLDRWLGSEPGNRVAGTRFQQLSAPVAAKAVEDTAFYRYGRLLSRNDVGFDAARLGSSVADFHRACMDRLRNFPDAMLATATHDHKRGEDLRARLAVLSEIPDQWSAFLSRCRSIAGERPDPADEIMLYQMIVGAWPPGLSPSDAKACQAFAERLATWQQKALREAKLHTDWTAPDQIYETRARDFLFGLFVPANGFLSLAYAFVEVIAPTGAVNGLVQTALKMTVAGMPDFFQGTEFWDFSLVDPDNRRPVDYAIRRDALAANAAPVACLQSWRNGLVKQAVIRNVLGLRRELPNLFARGDYRPLQVNGALAEKIVAFTRSFDGSALIVVAPRLTHALLRKDSIVLDPDRLQANTLSLPEHLQGRSFRSALSSDSVIVAEAELELGSMLTDFPLAILYQNEIA